MRTLSLLALVAMLAGCSTDSQTSAPAAFAPVSLDYPYSARVDVVDNLHGVKVDDPYRWLEQMDSSTTKAWVKAQNAVARPYLEDVPGRDAIRTRLEELWNYERFGVPEKQGGRYFFKRNDGLQNQDVLYVADSLDATPRVLIDPNGFAEDGTVAMASQSISHDGRYVAFGVSDGGSDWKQWHVCDVETGEYLADTLDYIKFSSMSWLPDSSGFFYSRYPVGTDGRGDGSAPVAIYFHALGDEQEADRKIFDIPDQPRRSPYATVTQDGRYLIISVWEGYEANAVYYKDLHDRSQRVHKLLDTWDARYGFLGNDGSTFYFLTTLEAPRWRVIAIDVANPGRSSWREVVPEADEPLEDASFVGGRFIAQYLRDARSVVRVYDAQGELQDTVDLPGIGTVGGFGGTSDDPETFYSFTGFTTPREIHRYDVSTGESSLFRRSQVSFDPDGFETKQIFYSSRDGTRVPMFIVNRKGLRRNGRNPTLLYGYGGFNASMTPYLSVSRLVWMEMGGVLAIPNLRGGGEYGEQWHRAGTKLQKQNVFDDFIAAAEWLIENNYTSTPKLAIQGGSNGGLLVGACMTQRPSLFGACLPAVGVLDMLRYHLPSMNARNWSSDYGLAENADEFRALYAYSPYHNVRSDVCYPPTLITTGDHDDRVVPWHSYKFAAALQEAQGCDAPILLRVETRAGHGAGTPTWMRMEQITDTWAFLVRELGIKVNLKTAG